MASLEQLRRKVQTRLRDFEQNRIQPEEIKILLNEGLDKFTSATEFLKTTIVQNIVAATNPYVLTLPGYRIKRILTLKLYDGSTDNYPILPITIEKMDRSGDYDWRNRSASKPELYIRNLNPSAPLGLSRDTVWLYPTPDSAYTSGLRATVVVGTDNFLAAEADELPVPEIVAEEAVVNYALGEAFIRLSLDFPENKDVYLDHSKLYRARFEEDMIDAAVQAKTGYDKAPIESRVYFM